MNNNNEHITVNEVSILLSDKLAEYEEKIGQDVNLNTLGILKAEADSTTKFLLSTKRGQPKAVIVFSRTSAPDLIMRGVKTAESIRKVVGVDLGRAIIEPISNGYAGNRSYVILPWYREFSNRKLIRVYQRLSLSNSLLQWLLNSTAIAADTYGYTKETSNSFRGVLDHLQKQKFCNSEISSAIEKSIDRLELNYWRPRYSIDHNDLWLGNIMLNPLNISKIKSRYTYVIIDWGGANQYGYGIYDLIRLSYGLRLSDVQLRMELIKHSKALQCNLKDLSGHLLASFGRLHQHLECFPEDVYLKTFQKCWNTFSHALPEIN